MSTVWFEDAAPGKSHTPLGAKVEKIWDKAELGSTISAGDLVAIKVHFGEPGNITFISPVLVRKIVDKVKAAGGRPFLTDANTIYMGRRANSVDHINAAIENGWAYSVVGAPIVIADGLRGHEYVKVPVGGKHFQEVKIGSAVIHADAMVVVSHFKGHMLAGFGGAIKNVGMGLGNRAGKREMHSDGLPIVREERCTACGKCIPWCPEGAMSLPTTVPAPDGGKAIVGIDMQTCIGCGECAASCPTGAIGFDWKTDHQTFQEKMVEYAKGALAGKEGKCSYINFLTAITPDCDCLGWSDQPLLPDIGLVASTDIVSVEKASLDLVSEAWGLQDSVDGGGPADPFLDHHGIDGRRVIEYAAELGLGSISYKLSR